MHQTLFHIPDQIAGMPVFGFGILLVLWGLVSFGILAWLVRRQGFNADTLSYVPILAVVAALIAWLLPVLCKEKGLPIQGYGVMMLVAVVFATGLAAWRARRLGQDPEMVFSLAFWLFLPGILGARAFYVIQKWSEQYWPVYDEHGIGALLGAVVNVAEGGLVVYGGLLGGVVGLVLFVRKYRLPLLAICDLVAPAMMLGLAIGRIGCLLNGCCYGGACDHAWAVTFPQGTAPYISQVTRGQMFGFTVGSNPDAEPVVMRVLPDSPAAKVGLKAGDRLERVGPYNVQAAGHVHIAMEKLFYHKQPITIRVAGRPSFVLPVVAVRPRSQPVHPTQAYSTINALLLCLLLLAYDPFSRRDGELFAMMITVYPVGRFLLEIVRTDEGDFLGTGLSISQNVSLLLFVCAIGLWFYVMRQPVGRAFARQPGANAAGV